jgi:acyl carrier protein
MFYAGRQSDESRRVGLERQTKLEEDVAKLIVEAVNLDKPVAELDPNMPLFGEGLGLDSIDVLEIALAVSKKYGFQLRSDDPNNRRIFASLRSLSAHIEQHRTC